MCTKVRYTNRANALGSLDTIDKQYTDKNAKYPKREYFCRICGGWHITSRPPDESNRKHKEKQKEINFKAMVSKASFMLKNKGIKFDE